MGRMAYGAKTAMNFGVVPQPYVDTGVMVYGVKVAREAPGLVRRLRRRGLRGNNDLDFTAMRTPYYSDNNPEPAGGGRLAFTLGLRRRTVLGDFSVGASFTGGRYDRNARLKYVALAGDARSSSDRSCSAASTRCAETDLDPNATGYRFEVMDPYLNKEGWYAEIEHPLGKRLVRGVPVRGAPPLGRAASPVLRR